MPFAAILTVDYSQTIGTSAVTVLNQSQIALNGRNPQLLRIYNVSSSTTIWVSRNGSPAAVGAAGSFPIAPLSYELWVEPGPVPLNAVSIVATAAGTPVTIEVG